MDITDRATLAEERARDASLAQRKPAGPAATGACLWCDEPLPDGRRWCNPECRDFWERARS